MSARKWQYIGVLGLIISSHSMSAMGAPPAASVDALYGKLPLSFEANMGQADPSVKFLARGRGYGLMLTGTEAVLVLQPGSKAAARGTKSLRGKQRRLASKISRASVRIRVANSDPAAFLNGGQLLPGKANYFRGRDPAKWRTGIATYAKVEQKGVYPGIDLVYYGNQRELEYDFVVAPGADPSQIRLAYDGVEGMEVEADGGVALRTRLGTIRQHSPVVYQEIDGVIRKLPAAHVITGPNEVGFQVKDYDASRPLIIDPTVSYGTLLGGAYDDFGYAIAVDSSGSAYVCGLTVSLDFPITPDAVQGGSSANDYDAFVTKLNPTGTALVYSTFLGGDDLGDSSAAAIAVDSAGNAYVGGMTLSSTFPTTAGAFQPGTTDTCCQDTFFTKLNAAGSQLLYSTFVAGTDHEDLLGLAIDSSGNVYLTGWTDSLDFPSTAGAFQTTNNAGDAFVAKLNPSASGAASLVYSTFLGGSGLEEGLGIAVDSSGSAYVSGDTQSTNFPATQGAYRSPTAAGMDAFVVKVNPAGSALTYSALLGGSGDETGFRVLVDSQGNAYVAGPTQSSNFPTTAGVYQATQQGSDDIFVGKLNPAGSALVYSTFIGGSGSEVPFGLALDSRGYAYLTGKTSSTNFPATADALRSTLAGTGDGFVCQLNDTGSALLYSTYLGGSSDEEGDSIALDPNGNAYISGTTGSSDFPTTPDAYQTVASPLDAFIVKMTFGSPPPPARSIRIISGNNQGGVVNTDLPSPLVVEVDEGSTPVANATVTFFPTNATVTSSTVQTDAAGRAQTTVKLGTTAGTATVTASTEGVATPVVFTASVSSTPGPDGGIAVTSAASFALPPVAPGMLAVIWSQTGAPDFTAATQHAPSLPLPTSMGGVWVTIQDSGGTSRDVGLLDVTPRQLNGVIPDATQGGNATITVHRSDGGVSTGTVMIESVAPGLFSATSDGQGLAVGQAIRVKADGTWSTADLCRWDSAQNKTVSVPIDMGDETDRTILVVYGTGIRGRTDLVNVNATVGGQNTLVDYAGAQGNFVGLDQVNLQLPRSLRGQGDVSISLTVDGKTANALKVSMAALPAAPTISSIDPTSADPGQTITTFTVNGSNMGRVTALEFAPADGITITNLNVTSTSVTARVVIANNAASGIRQVDVVSPEGKSGTLPFTINASVDPGFLISNLRAGPSATVASGDTLPITVDYVDPQGAVSSGQVRVNYSINNGGIVGWTTATPTIGPAGTLTITLTFTQFHFTNGLDLSITVSLEAPPGIRRSNTLTGTFHTGPPGMSGNWRIVATSSVYPITSISTGFITQNGNNLSGTLAMSGTPCGPTGTLTGTLTGSTLNMDLNEGGQHVTLTGTLAADKNSASGTYTAPVGGCTAGDMGTWAGTRTQ